MTALRSRAPRRPRRNVLRAFAGLAASLCLVVLLLAALTLSLAPRAGDGAPPDAAAARRAAETGMALRAFLDADGATGRIALDAAGIDALLASAGRFAPGLRGRVDLGADRVSLLLSAGAPHLPPGLWANLDLGFATDAQGLRVVSARLGSLPLPPALVEAALIAGLDRLLGAPGLGRAALGGVADLATDGGRVGVSLAHDPEARAALIAALRARLDGAAGGGIAAPALAGLYALDWNGDRGRLPREGSVLPWIEFPVRRALRQAEREGTDPVTELRGGLLALAVYCGEPALGPAVGLRLPERMRGDDNHCDGPTLAGRDDLKRHFAVSAGIAAARAGGAVAGIGELKELMDSGEGGSGFSFDDIAANLAGQRFAEAFLAADPADWPAMLDLIRAESDILPSLDGLPRGLPEAEFRARFGDVDSPEFAAMMADIDARIAAAPLHGACPGG